MPYAAPNHQHHPKPDTRAYDAARGSASARGYDASWRRLRAWFLRRNPLCVLCLASGITEPATDVDHIVAKRNGGTDHTSNLQPLCHACHSRKTAGERRA